jgi:sugar lactone lactonase YvrE
MKFSPDGKLLMRLGVPGIYGNDKTHFSQPSDVITDDQGNIYVADGHDSPPANNRIVKFDKNGKYLKEWPTCHPSQARQIDCSHGLAMDSQGRLFVANRGNNVITIFDQEGKMLAIWPHAGKPTGFAIDKNDILYVSDSQTGIGNQNSFVKGVHIVNAKTGEVTAFLPDPLNNSSPWNAGSTLSPEGVTVDDAGVIYTSGVTPPGLTKWTLQKNIQVVSPTARGGGGGN